MNCVAMKSYREIIKYGDAINKFKYNCKCGRKVVMPNNVDKKICSWCGNYVFKNKRQEFKYRIKERLLNEK